MAKNILITISEFGYWGEELVGPLMAIDDAGYNTDFITPNGKKPGVLPPSIDSSYIDPPLGRTVVSDHMAEKVVALDSSQRLNQPLNLSQVMPERPYLSRENYLAELETYSHNLEDVAATIVEKYDCLLLVGGSGTVVDMANNQRLHDLILEFYKHDKLISAECYGVACLAFARDFRQRKSIIRNKRVTGHPIEYDYKDGTGFLGVDMNFGPPPYPLEFILRDAVGPDGEYFGNVGNRTSVIVDYPFITSRSTASSVLCGQKIVECLENGLTRYGW